VEYGELAGWWQEGQSGRKTSPENPLLGKSRGKSANPGWAISSEILLLFWSSMDQLFKTLTYLTSLILSKKLVFIFFYSTVAM